jgi:hypothetical protein
MSFKLLAIRPLSGCNRKFLKNLEENRIYKFYNDYKFYFDNNIEATDAIEGEITKIEYKPENAVPNDLFGKNISISAIVGKNGSGKSSLVELMYVAIYNISIDLKIYKESYNKEDVHCEIYYSTYNEHEKKEEYLFIKLINKKDIKFINLNNEYDEFDITSDLFYSIVSNYSFYGLNSKFTGEWIERIFHKNDGYETPIVINPMRTDGNIDVNKEYSLAKDRLLSTILNNNENAKTIIEGKKVSKLILKIKDKNYLNDNTRIKKKDYLEKYLEKIFNSFKDDIEFEDDIDINKIKEIIESNHNVVNKATDYILYKLKRISENYYKENTNFCEINYDDKETIYRFLENIKNNDFGSHVTYKLRQVINFLKFDLFPKVENKEYYGEELEKITDEIFQHRKLRLSEHENKIVKNNPNITIIFPFWLISNFSILPPPIYDIDYEFEDSSKFSNLSSGETQKIYSINTILYHLINLSSKHHNYLYIGDETIKDIKYKFVNIIFDEVELYAHPEMQRTFINELINKIKNSYLRGINGINILFITHSPFILSDIPKQNVLFLDVIKKVDKDNDPILKNGKEQFFSSPQEYEGDNTFGENIHQMLTNGFFISDTKGAFVTNKIKEFLEFYNNRFSKTKQDFELQLSFFENLINLIGEDYIRRILTNHLNDLFKYFKIIRKKTNTELINDKADLEEKLRNINNLLGDEKN